MAKTTGLTIWLTGLGLAGKSSIAELLAAKLAAAGRRVELLDDADWAETLANGPGTNKAERNLLVRRLGSMAMVLTRNDVVTIVAALSPYREEREQLRRKIGRFVEVYVDAPTETLIEREIAQEKEIARTTKSEIREGRMQKALRGEISMIGITEPYETPVNPEVTIETHKKSIDACCLQILQSLCEIGYFTPDEIEAISGMRVRRYNKPEEGPMTPPKSRGGILLIPKNSPLKAELLKNPGKIPDQIKKALKVTAAEVKAEKQAALLGSKEEKTPVHKGEDKATPAIATAQAKKAASIAKPESKKTIKEVAAKKDEKSAPKKAAPAKPELKKEKAAAPAKAESKKPIKKEVAAKKEEKPAPKKAAPSKPESKKEKAAAPAKAESKKPIKKEVAAKKDEKPAPKKAAPAKPESKKEKAAVPAKAESKKPIKKEAATKKDEKPAPKKAAPAKPESKKEKAAAPAKAESKKPIKKEGKEAPKKAEKPAPKKAAPPKPEDKKSAAKPKKKIEKN
ncbi:MAG: adenylyl-sulfate kinase [Myxococcales bacterium]|jgi:adenylylsulfate kinase|nr:adenylyl-sulfate kinase [Myxococcales bacterium]